MHKHSRVNDLYASAHILSADEPADPPQFPEISTHNHDLMDSGWCPVAGLHSGSMKRHRGLDKHSCGKTIAPHERTCAVALNMASAGTPQSLPSGCSFMLSILIKDIIKTALHPVSLWFSTFFAMCSCFILH